MKRSTLRAALGLHVGWFGTVGILLAIGMGHSHDDLFTAVGGAVLGAFTGAVLLPVAVWWRSRMRTRKATS